MEILGNIIKEARENKQLTQYCLAHLMNKSQALIALWEKGKRDPSTIDMIKMIVVLNIEIEKLKQCVNATEFDLNKSVKDRWIEQQLLNL